MKSNTRWTSAVALVLLGLLASSAFAGRVTGYIGKDGRFIQRPDGSPPDFSKSNNYSSKENHNPYTGKAGNTPRLPK